MIFEPQHGHQSPALRRCYALYEIAYTAVDFGAALSFIVGSIMFFSEEDVILFPSDAPDNLTVYLQSFGICNNSFFEILKEDFLYKEQVSLEICMSFSAKTTSLLSSHFKTNFVLEDS